MEVNRKWISISSTITREERDELARLAEQKGLKVGSLIKAALRAYTSNEVMAVAASIGLHPEELIRKAVLLYAEKTRGQDERSLRHQLIRLELWIKKFYLLTSGNNAALFRQMHVEIEKQIQANMKEASETEQGIVNPTPKAD